MSMQGSSNDPAEKAAEEEKEAIAKEERQDRDDPEERQKTQEWDEYKDGKLGFPRYSQCS